MSIWMSLLSVVLVTVLSVFFYRAFQTALNERVLLQLTSVKRLKKVQIEAYLNRIWEDFTNEPVDGPNPNSFVIDADQLDTLGRNAGLAFQSPVAGIYDLTPYSDSGALSLLLIRPLDSLQYAVRRHPGAAIQRILLERTGMGESGESYLVGRDYHLRSLSRFFPEQAPYSFRAETEGVKQALAGKQGTGIFPDYRGVMVYSSYQPIQFKHLNWVILSEMDVEEVQAPLLELKRQLVAIVIFVLLLAILISYFMARAFSKPILRMRSHLHDMAAGNYDITISPGKGPKELGALFTALGDLKASIKGAIHFSQQIGQMELSADFEPLGDNDKLGHSLLKMREQLIRYHQLQEQNNLANQKSFLNGQEKERSRLAKELHDGLGPLLTSLKLSIQSTDLPAPRKTQLKQLLDEMIVEVRRMTYDLMPQALLDFGVGKAVVHLTEMVRKSSKLNVHYVNSMKDDDPAGLDTETHINLFRIIQELLNNTLKHAQAENVRLSLTQFDDKVALYYQDDGKGFKLDEVQYGYGLKNIKERVKVFNGYLSIHADEHGTEVEVEIPIKDE
ncbi:sensor histidine kinase [Flavilitoribacter nigricans]|nr:ATP-binding protein [Flavilitoribacter nigricans]